MKELSIEEKAKRYDEAIERANELNYVSDNDSLQRKVVERLFPELKDKESKDEKIRQFLLNFVRHYMDDSDSDELSREDCLAWIEKKGEYKINEYRTWLNIVSQVLTEFQGIGQYLDNSICQDIAKMLQEKYCFDDTSADWDRVYRKGLDAGEVYGYNKAKKEQKPAWSDYDRDMLDNLIDDEYSPLGAEYISWFKDIKERFGNIEKKPSNKVEPKFKVGDCIVRNGLGTYKIVEVCKSWYEVISYKDGLQYSIGFDDEKNCHLWSKEDIKRGDVIQLGEVTAIFNEHIGNEKCTCYCSIFNGEFEIPINYDDSIYGFYYCSPATKEQRDLLFKKMKEAGFKWYSKKKMLK